MRNARILLFLLLIALGAISYVGLRNGWEMPSVPGGDQQAAVAPPARDQKPAGEDVRPSFDIVRAEPTGDLVMAGRAEPESTVIVESNGKPIGTAQADANGEWFIQPEAPVSKGEHALQLKSLSPKGNRVLFSKQRLALSIGGEAGKSQPLVALTEEGQATRVLQMSPAASDDKRSGAPAPAVTANLQEPPSGKPASEPAVQVSFTSIDYEPGEGRSVLYLSGRGSPGARLMLYVGNEFAGLATVDATGSWTHKAFRDLGAGSHPLRADSVDMASGKVLARAEVNFDRQAPTVVASAGAVAPTRSFASVATSEPQTDLRGRSPGNSAGARTAEAKAEEETSEADVAGTGANVIVVRRGDTLWQIAERHYGNGAKYTQIFQNNKDQIRNPNRIYPSQRFNVPQ